MRLEMFLPTEKNCINKQDIPKNFAGEAWWQDAFNSGTVIDREEMKRLLR